MKAPNKCVRFLMVFLIGMLTFSLTVYANSGAGQLSQIEGYPIDSDVYTTQQRTIVPDLLHTNPYIHLKDISKYRNTRR